MTETPMLQFAGLSGAVYTLWLRDQEGKTFPVTLQEVLDEMDWTDRTVLFALADEIHQLQMTRYARRQPPPEENW